MTASVGTVETPQAASTPTPQAAPTQTDARAELRAKTLAGLAASRSAPVPAAEAAPAAPSDAAPVEPEAATVTSEATAAPAAATEQAGAAVEPPGMSAVRKAEQHARKQLAQERATMLAEFEQQKAGWQTKLDQAAAIDRATQNARRDPISALKALGFTEADFDGLGRMIYAHSPEGAKDPKQKAAAEASLRERESRTAVEKLQAELAELKTSMSTREQAQQAQAQLDAYLTSVTKGVTDQTPLAKAALIKSPERTRQALAAVADRLYTESGPTHELRDIPTAAEVLQAYEAQRSAELEELGIDPKTLGRPTPSAAPAARPTTTIAPSGTAAPVTPKGKPTREEMIAGMAKIRTAV